MFVTKADADLLADHSTDEFRLFGMDEVVFLKTIKGQDGQSDFVGIFSADGIAVFATPSLELAQLEARQNKIESALVH